MGKVTVVLSGGQDSTICLHWAINQKYEEIRAITFDYGQRHSAEIEAAFAITKLAGVKHTNMILSPDTLRSKSPLTSDAELAQYDDGALPGGLEKTFVPMRNQTFLTIAAAEAYRNGHTNLITGTCQEDYGGYPDCTRRFIDALEVVSTLGTFTGKDGALDKLSIITPLMFLTKAQSVELAIRLGWDCWYALAYTHTSYDGAFPPTGHDHATVLRAKGFDQHGSPDPLVLRAYYLGGLDGEQIFDLPTTSNYDSFRGAVTHDVCVRDFLRACWDHLNG